ncbi:MAG: type II toxin-antitoxin system prevent-host-death family antitoxin [Desulfobacteraceae bacterium]
MATRTVTVSDFQARLPQILSMVSAGDVVIISEDDKPLAKIVPILKQGNRRIAGLNKGKIQTSPDFDDALPENFWLGSR